MDNLDPRLTSFVSGVVAILVPIANQTFGWHLTTGTVLTIVLGLVALGLMEVGHAHASAVKQSPMQEIMELLKTLPNLIEETAKRVNRPVDPGIKAAGDMARGVTVQDVVK